MSSLTSGRPPQERGGGPTEPIRSLLEQNFPDKDIGPAAFSTIQILYDIFERKSVLKKLLLVVIMTNTFLTWTNYIFFSSVLAKYQSA